MQSEPLIFLTHIEVTWGFTCQWLSPGLESCKLGLWVHELRPQILGHPSPLTFGIKLPPPLWSLKNASPEEQPLPLTLPQSEAGRTLEIG